MNLIKMNLYRFFRMKAVYILMIITALLVVFTVLDGKNMPEDEVQLYKQIEAENGGDSSFGVSVSILDTFSIDRVTSEFIGSQLLLIFIAIFVSCFVNEERVKGYLKNLNSCTDQKTFLFISKIPIVCLFVLLLFACVWISALTCCDVVIDCSMRELMLFTVMQLLLHMVFAIFMCMLNELFRSQLVGIIIGCAAAIAIPTLLLSSIMDMVPGLSKLSHICFFFTAPLVAQIKVEQNIEAPAALPIIFGIVIVLGIVYSLVGTISIKKRDIY